MSVAESGAASIGKSVEIRGELKGSEDLLIDGRVEGTITLTDSRLTIGPTARVDADVAARDVVILGLVNGNVTASARVDLRKGGNLVGNIRAVRLSIEEGASLSGKVDLTQPGGEAAKSVSSGSLLSGVSTVPASAAYPTLSAF
jgi:cytoskeletal protein CcmA (bactofilin family)